MDLKRIKYWLHHQRKNFRMSLMSLFINLLLLNECMEPLMKTKTKQLRRILSDVILIASKII